MEKQLLNLRNRIFFLSFWKSVKQFQDFLTCNQKQLIMKKLEIFVILKILDLIGCSIVLRNNVVAAIDSEIKLFILNIDWTLYVIFKECINNQFAF